MWTTVVYRTTRHRAQPDTTYYQSQGVTDVASQLITYMLTMRIANTFFITLTLQVSEFCRLYAKTSLTKYTKTHLIAGYPSLRAM